MLCVNVWNYRVIYLQELNDESYEVFLNVHPDKEKYKACLFKTLMLK